MNSTLIIILSETRAFEETYALMSKNLIEVCKADLALCIADNEREIKDNPFYQNAKYIWQFPEPKDWANAFDLMQEDLSSNENWRVLLEVKDQWLGGIKGKGAHPGSAGILLFFRYFLKKSILNSGLQNKYERFIITRSDFMHRIPHVPLNLLDPKYIWIPFGEDAGGGYTDRHIVVNQSDLINVLSIADDIVLNPKQLLAEMNHFEYWNLERFIKFSFERMGIDNRVKRYPWSMYSIRLKSGHTRWSKGEFNENLGYHIKYPMEYKRYKLARFFIKQPKNWNRVNMALLNFMEFARLRQYIFWTPSEWSRAFKNLLIRLKKVV